MVYCRPNATKATIDFKYWELPGLDGELLLGLLIAVLRLLIAKNEIVGKKGHSHEHCCKFVPELFLIDTMCITKQDNTTLHEWSDLLKEIEEQGYEKAMEMVAVRKRLRADESEGRNSRRLYAQLDAEQTTAGWTCDAFSWR